MSTSAIGPWEKYQQESPSPKYAQESGPWDRYSVATPSASSSAGPTPNAHISATPKPTVGKRFEDAMIEFLKSADAPILSMTPDAILPRQLRGSATQDAYNALAKPFETAAISDPAWMRRVGDISRHARQMNNILGNMVPLAMGDAFPGESPFAGGSKGLMTSLVDKLAGVEPAVKEAQIARTVEIAHQSEQYESDLSAARESQEQIRAENISRYREQAQNLAQSNDTLAEEYNKALQQYQESVNKAAGEHVTASDRAARFNAEQKMQVMQREAAGREIENLQPKLQQNLQAVRGNIRNVLDARWDAVRQSVSGISPELANISSGLENATNEVDATNLEDFKKLYGRAFGDVNWGNLTFSDMQHIYTNLGDTLARGGLSYDVFGGLRTLQSEIGQEMENMISRSGLGKNGVSSFRALKADWGEYMSDWVDVNKRMNYGGSPLAHGLRNVDAPNTARVFEGPSGPRAIQLLEKYKMYGANPELFQQYRNLLDSYDDMPKGGKTMKVPKPKVIKSPEAPQYLEMTHVPYKPLPELPTRPLEPPPVDIEGIRRDQINLLKQAARRSAIRGAAYGTGGYLGYRFLKDMFPRLP